MLGELKLETMFPRGESHTRHDRLAAGEGGQQGKKLKPFPALGVGRGEQSKVGTLSSSQRHVNISIILGSLLLFLFFAFSGVASSRGS